jgi:hypothetical protein
MTAGSGSVQVRARESVCKWLLLYAASPFVAVVGVAAIFVPYLGLLLVMVAWMASRGTARTRQHQR